jgi:NTE family protein
VLSGGGARAAFQAGALLYLAERLPAADFPIITGVSAGAINAAFIAAQRQDTRQAAQALASAWRSLSLDQVIDVKLRAVGLSGARWLWTLSGGGTSLSRQEKGLFDTAPLRGFLQQQLDVEAIEENVQAGRLRALALTATRYSTGQTVTFVHGRAGVPIWERVQRCGVRSRISVDHVMASAALPLVFPAVRIEGEYYGDGSIRQAAPLAPAVHLGADRLLAIATRYPPTLDEVRGRAGAGYPPPARLVALLLETLFLDTLEQDAERQNRVLDALPYGMPNPDALRRIGLLVIRPSRDLATLAEVYKRRLPRSLRLVLRGLGVQRVPGAELLSYLMFEEPYLSRLIELGYEDTRARWIDIERFLAPDR